MSKNVLTVNFIIQILKNKHTFNKKYKKLKKLSSLSERTQLSQFFILFEESVFNFQYLNDKMHNYVKQNIIVHFIIQKLKSKHTFLRKYKKLRKLNPLNLTEREETKTRYFPPQTSLGYIPLLVKIFEFNFMCFKMMICIKKVIGSLFLTQNRLFSTCQSRLKFQILTKHPK